MVKKHKIWYYPLIHTLIHRSQAVEKWRSIEWKLLIFFLIGRIWFFWHNWGERMGFDTGAHAEMLQLISWSNPDTNMHESFYGYHPPLGFLFARTFLLMGFSDTHAIQIVSILASLVLFFTIRQTLKYLQLLYEPQGTIFLYIFASIPLQLFMAVSMNLDIIILALTSIVLYCSVRLFWNSNTGGSTTSENIEKNTWYTCLVSALCIGMLVKFSGLLMLGLPGLCALLRPAKTQWFRFAFRGGIVASLVVAIVLPYYGNRYYFQEGTLFPNNGDWIVEGALRESRDKRDENRIKFLVDMFKPTQVHASKGYTHRDYEVLRLSDTWRDFWVKDQFLGGTTEFAKKVGVLYLRFIPILLVLGVFFLIRARNKRDPWYRFGFIVLGFSAVQLLAFIHYMYSNPLAGWGPAKGVYVAPVCLGIAYILATVLGQYTHIVSKRLLPFVPLIERAVIVTVFVFVGLNHFWNIY